MIISGLLTLRVDDADDVRIPTTEPVALDTPAYEAPVQTDPGL